MNRLEFQRLVESIFNDLCPDWTDDYLAQSPLAAFLFCQEVRQRVGLPTISPEAYCLLAKELATCSGDRAILKGLVNLRKQGLSSHARTPAGQGDDAIPDPGA